MSPEFETAFAEYERLRAIEKAYPGCEIEDEKAWEPGFDAALGATTAAFDAMIVIPVDDGMQAASKLRALCDFYDIGACGLDRAKLNQVFAEILAILWPTDAA